MMKLYKYIGLEDILNLVKEDSQGQRISNADDVLIWLASTNQQLDELKQVVATFIIDSNGELHIADRRSEHVVCAGGKEVLSAGEITFAIEKGNLEVFAVTNQSTGYFPEPESWAWVQNALEKAKINNPREFTSKYEFRKCDTCGAKVLIKDDWFYCYECGSELNKKWNFY